MSDMEIEVDGATPFIERGFQSCGPYQWARELVKNSIEAGATKVLFGVEWQAVEELGVYRRIVVDNGQGMSTAELKKYFRSIGVSSKKIAGVHQNYGLGARISLLPRNKAGLVVISYKNKEASMIWMAYDEEKDKYVIVELEDEATGKRDSVVPPQDFSEREGLACDFSKIRDYATFGGEPLIEEHGTIYVMLGNDLEEDTIISTDEPDAKGPIKFLNTRFWDVTDIELRVAEFKGPNRKTQWPKDRDDKDDKRRLQLRRIRGAKYYIYAKPKDAKGELAHSGVVMLDEGRVSAHWFLYEGERQPMHAIVENDGYIAYTYKDELYQWTKDKTAFRQFGISEDIVQKKLWIILEAKQLSDKDPVPWGVYPDDARTMLRFTGDGCKGANPPRGEWGQDFQSKMPQEIIDAIMLARGDASYEVDKEYMKKLASRYGQRWMKTVLIAAEAASKLKAKRTGDTAMIVTPGGGEQTHRVFPKGARRPKAAAPKRPGPGSLSKKGKLTEAESLEGKGKTAAVEVVVPVDLPVLRMSDNCEDFDEPWHLAKYDPNDVVVKGPVVVINVSPESSIMSDLVKNFQDQYAAIWAEEIRKKVIEAVGTIAVCKVAHAQQLTRHDLNQDQVAENYLTEKALTVALMGFIAEEAFISPKLGALGGKKKVA